MFRAVENGDFLCYVAEVERAMADVEAGLLGTAGVEEQRRGLAASHSVERETQELSKMLARVRQIIDLPSEASV